MPRHNFSLIGSLVDSFIPGLPLWLPADSDCIPKPIPSELFVSLFRSRATPAVQEGPFSGTSLSEPPTAAPKMRAPRRVEALCKSLRPKYPGTESSCPRQPFRGGDAGLLLICPRHVNLPHNARSAEVAGLLTADHSRDTPSRHYAVPGGTENILWFAILDLWTRSLSQSGLRERSTSPRFPSKNWQLSRASLQLTISNLCLELGCPTTNRRRTSPPACASGVEKVTVPPTSNECRHC